MLENRFRVDDLHVFYREAGVGQPIVLLHCTGGTSAQWRKLMNGMADRYRLMAIDLPSHGQSDDAPEGTTDGFDLEVRAIATCVENSDELVHLVGHSAGGGAAAKFAIEHPDKVKSLVLFEPALFGIMANGADPEGWDDFMGHCNEMITRFSTGNETGAAEAMVDYWSAPGTFQTIPPEQQAIITDGIWAAVEKAGKWVASPEEYSIDASQIQVPTLVLSGGASPRSAQGVSNILARYIRNVQFHLIDNVGHMAPITHAVQVNPLIEAFIQAHSD